MQDTKTVEAGERTHGWEPKLDATERQHKGAKHGQVFRGLNFVSCACGYHGTAHMGENRIVVWAEGRAN